MKSVLLPKSFYKIRYMSEVPLVARVTEETEEKIKLKCRKSDHPLARGYHQMRSNHQRKRQCIKFVTIACLFGSSFLIVLLLAYHLLPFSFYTLLATPHLSNLRYSFEDFTNRDNRRCTEVKNDSFQTYINDAKASKEADANILKQIEAFYKSSFKDKVLTFVTYKERLYLLQLILQLLQDANIRCAVYANTALGIYMAHDLFPWDGQLHLTAYFEDRMRLKDVVEKFNASPTIKIQPSLTKDTKFATLKKFELKFLEKTIYGKGKLWIEVLDADPTWIKPILDIYWWHEESASTANVKPMIAVDSDIGIFKFPRSVWYPLSRYPLGPLVVPTPFNLRQFLLLYFSVDRIDCSFTTSLANVREESRDLSNVGTSLYTEEQCKEWLDHYPLVTRRVIHDNCSLEILHLSTKELRRTYMYHSFSNA